MSFDQSLLSRRARVLGQPTGCSMTDRCIWSRAAARLVCKDAGGAGISDAYNNPMPSVDCILG